MKPSTMLYRNLLAMETEELLRSLSGRRRGAHGRLRQDHAGAADGRDQRMDLPAIFMPAGPMLRGNWHGQDARLAAPTSGNTGPSCAPATITEQRLAGHGGRHRALAGHCMTMGTASTMTSIAEALGLTLPGAASIPARRLAPRAHGRACGRRIVEMVWEDLTAARHPDARSLRERDHRRAWRWAARPTRSST